MNSHFETTQFFNEQMTAGDQGFQITSEWTLSVLADSGWYGIDFSLAERFTIGQN
jgi:Leishmanolysin